MNSTIRPPVRASMYNETTGPTPSRAHSRARSSAVDSSGGSNVSLACRASAARSLTRSPNRTCSGLRSVSAVGFDAVSPATDSPPLELDALVAAWVFPLGFGDNGAGSALDTGLCVETDDALL
ncbi:hypothetical protein HFX_2744 [Haloferax mediterranei ATCC 33500]|uniref:Uncharacterized protein n=1 Tax=Haloferax mediterranei (strain ATCC 33500 / DSM 1411 / JCM 8866 / NBRC 14739 / NCIMB 2177 / R-4) TaxID=523841 RepID=I3R860_HALMT|nr:hypothetical protein HFX_2744 [Haloferax mediterranei ATCC 33500]